MNLLWWIPKPQIHGFIGSIIGSIGSGLGAIASSALGSVASGLFNADQADENRDFQQYNSDTAYRRAMADMRAGGLNPILAGKLGGATTPAGSLATMPDLGGSISSAMSASANLQQADTQQELAEWQERKIEMEINNIAEQTFLTADQAALARQKVKQSMAEINRIKAQEGLTSALTAIPAVAADIINSMRSQAGVKDQSAVEGKIQSLMKSLIQRRDENRKFNKDARAKYRTGGKY